MLWNPHDCLTDWLTEHMEQKRFKNCQQLINKSSAFCETGRWIMLRSSRYYALYLPSLIHSTLSQPIYLKSVKILSRHLHLDLARHLVVSNFTTNIVWISYRFHTFYWPHLSKSWFFHPNNMHRMLKFMKLPVI
jgi:hypothetical protein